MKLKFIERRECWRLTWLGRVSLSVLTTGIGLIFMFSVYPFLAITEREAEEILVVEGWMPARFVEKVAEYYITNGYSDLILSRTLYKDKPVYESGEFVANYIANRLVELGLNENEIHIVYNEPKQKDRTYGSAESVKSWLLLNRAGIQSLDVATRGAHARRSRLLYQKAFGTKYKIGVLSFQDHSHDPEKWWTSSEGIREVPFEFIAYLYARYIFRPN